MTAIAAAPASASPLVVPDAFRAKLDAAREAGVALAAEFAQTHNPTDRQMVTDWALLKLPFAPKSDAEDLAYLRKVVRARTPAGVAKARDWAAHGLDGAWNKLLEQYTRGVGPEQAKAARKLLEDALMLTNTITQTAKASNARKRPFVVDPKLPLAVDRPGNNPSYPSGHTTAAYAACLVLAHLMPDRREEFLAIASEASWSRVYAGVHFPSDVVAGVQLASTVVSYLNTASGVRPLLGTANLPGTTAAAAASAA